MPDQDCVMYHFIAFVRTPEGDLVELDGTKAGPAVIQTGCENLLESAIKEVKRRLEGEHISERINLMALV